MLNLSKCRDWGVVCLLAAILTIINWKYFSYTIQGYDFIAHAKTAAAFAQYGDVLTPHFLYHMALAGVTALLGGNYYHGTLLIMVTSKLVVFLILCRFFSRNTVGLAWGAFWAFILCFANPPQVLFLIDGGYTSLRETIIELYIGYHYLNIFHNPTYILLKPVALMLFLFITDRNLEPGKRDVIIVVVGAVLCALIKPSFIMSAAPVAFIFWLLRLWRQRINCTVLLGFWVSSVAVLLGQLLFYTQVYEATDGGGGGIVFSPLTVLSNWTDHLFLKFLLSILFVLVILWFNRSLVRDFRFQFAVLMFSVACAFTYLFTETGSASSDGNFIWGTHITVFMLFVCVIQRLGQAIVASGWQTRETLIPFFVLLFYLGGGVLWMFLGVELNVGV